jgi:malonyl-CoA O-methyltransferase
LARGKRIVTDELGLSSGALLAASTKDNAVTNDVTRENKSLVAKAFGRSARSYDEYACVQLAAARTLVSFIQARMPPRTDGDVALQAKQQWAVDLGAGTVPMARPLAEACPAHRWLALDVAPQMLAEARQRGRLDERWLPLCADASALPLRDESVALLYSSFALQWSESLARTLSEIDRVLERGGCAHIAVPVAGSLHEFSQSWQQVDDGVHINALASAASWLAAASGNGLICEHHQVTTIIEYYADVRAIGKMLKSTGAHHVHRSAPVGLMTPSRYANLVAAYENLRQDQGLPLSWNILFLTLEKPSK